MVSFILLTAINRIPGLSLRADDETEKKGMDMAELGELAYYWANRRLSNAVPAQQHKNLSREVIQASLSRLNGLDDPQKPLSKFLSPIPGDNRTCDIHGIGGVKMTDIDAQCHAQMTRMVNQLKGQGIDESRTSRDSFLRYDAGSYRSTV